MDRGLGNLDKDESFNAQKAFMIWTKPEYGYDSITLKLKY